MLTPKHHEISGLAALPGEPPRRELLERLGEELSQGAGLGALGRALALLRPMHPKGAAKVAAGDEPLAALLARGAPEEELLARLEELARRKACLACGTCCLTSSPTLYLEDLPLIRAGRIPLDSLFSLRAGERAFSARLGKSAPLESELIKLAEAPAGGCLFLREHNCSIYAARPLQCRWLECWSQRHAGHLEDRPRLGRAELLIGDDTALALAREYDLRLPAEELDQALLATARGEPAGEKRALALLELDHKLRAGAGARHGYSSEKLALLWGRPASVIALAYGLCLGLDQAGLPRLWAGNKGRTGQ